MGGGEGDDVLRAAQDSMEAREATRRSGERCGRAGQDGGGPSGGQKRKSAATGMPDAGIQHSARTQVNQGNSGKWNTRGPTPNERTMEQEQRGMAR